MAEEEYEEEYQVEGQQFEEEGEEYQEDAEIPGEVLFTSDGKMISLNGQLRGVKKNEKKTGASFLFENLVTNYFLSKWKKKVDTKKILQQSTSRPTGRNNPAERKRLNLKKGFAGLEKFFNRKKTEKLLDLFDTMESLPPNPKVVHDKDFGKLKILNNTTLNAKAMKKIKFFSKLNFILKINENLGDILMESINKMSERKGKN